MRMSTDWQKMRRYGFMFFLIFGGGVWINWLASELDGPGAVARMAVGVVFAAGSLMVWGYSTIRLNYGELRDYDEPRIDHRHGGFTLVELLVVMSIIAIVIGLGAPMIGSLRTQSGASATVTTISTAVNAARIYTHRAKQTDMGGGGFPIYPNEADYSGTAVLFTTIDVRIVENEQAATRVFTGNWQTADPADSLEPQFNGYKDIGTEPYKPSAIQRATDYISLPTNAGIAGVIHDASGLRFIAPPFAVRFTADGSLAMDGQPVVYDGDYDLQFDPSDTRPASYNPDTFQPAMNGSEGKYTLPFESIESVTALVAFDASNFRTEGPGWSGTDAEIRDWLLENGAAINFSPMTGLAITNQ